MKYGDENHEFFISKSCLLPKAIIFLCFNNKLDDWNNIFVFGLLMICNWRPNWWTLMAKVKELASAYILLRIRWLGECCLLSVIQHQMIAVNLLNLIRYHSAEDRRVACGFFLLYFPYKWGLCRFQNLFTFASESKEAFTNKPRWVL